MLFALCIVCLDVDGLDLSIAAVSVDLFCTVLLCFEGLKIGADKGDTSNVSLYEMAGRTGGGADYGTTN